MKQHGKAAVVAMVLAVSLLNGCSTWSPQTSAESQFSDDRQLVDDVQNRLKQDSIAGRFAFGVDAQNGVVTLRGAVLDDAIRSRAIGIARGTPGVKNVVDKLYGP